MTGLSDRAVPERRFIRLDKVSRQTLRTMLDEMQEEIGKVAPAFKPEAADRNGLTAVIGEMERRNML